MDATPSVERGQPKVIVIRGPAGAGKSTTAQALLGRLTGANRDAVYLEQDHFRNIVTKACKNARCVI